MILRILILCALPLLAGAQQPFEGSIRYLKTMNWAKQFAALDYMSQQQRDKMSYIWGGRSEWKMYTTLHLNATQSKYEDSEEAAEKDDEGYSWRRETYQIRRNFATNTMTDAIQMLGKVYLVEDSMRAPQWKILNDLKEVAGHLCMSAFWEDTIKKQKVTAWFAMDIPISAGPERFFGLPGLIMEVDVNNGAMVITADKMDAKNLTTELDLPKKLKGKKISEKEYFSMITKHMDEKRKAEEPYFWGMRY